LSGWEAGGFWAAYIGYGTKVQGQTVAGVLPGGLWMPFLLAVGLQGVRRART